MIRRSNVQRTMYNVQRHGVRERACQRTSLLSEIATLVGLARNDMVE